MILTKYAGAGIGILSLASVVVYLYIRVGIASANGMTVFLLFLWLVGWFSFAHAYRIAGPEKAGRTLSVFGLYAIAILLLIARSNHLVFGMDQSSSSVYSEVSIVALASVFWPSIYRRV